MNASAIWHRKIRNKIFNIRFLSLCSKCCSELGVDLPLFLKEGGQHQFPSKFWSYWGCCMWIFFLPLSWKAVAEQLCAQYFDKSLQLFYLRVLAILFADVTGQATIHSCNSVNIDNLREWLVVQMDSHEASVNLRCWEVQNPSALRFNVHAF